MIQEHRYSLTRVCLRRGELTLPRSLTGLFDSDGPVTVSDSLTGTELQLDLQGQRVLSGLGAFFEEHELDVNDALLIRRAEDGTISITPQKRERRPDYSSERARSQIVAVVLENAPLTEAEARALLPGLPAGFDLAGVLQSSGRLRLHAGRWHDGSDFQEEQFEREVDEALEHAVRSHTEAAAEPVPAEPAAVQGRPDSSLPGRLARLGFQVVALNGTAWLLESAVSGSTTQGFRVLASEVTPGSRLDWAALLEQRRQQSADYLAVFGPERDLQPLSAPAELAHASLWPLEALNQLEEIAHDLPLSPADLEDNFRQDGLLARGFERFEQAVNRRISERGAFSAVLSNLAGFPAAASFRLEDAARNVDRETAKAVLDQLSRSPFQLVMRRGSGDYYLRTDVHSALRQLAEYARSLQAHMPQPRRELAAQRG